jgi:multicomponent Na+:H+ antiporter subunit G
MELGFTIAAAVLLGLGAFFAVSATIGILRFPDFFTRLHPAGMNDTLGVFFLICGMLVECAQYGYGYIVWGRLLLVFIFLWMASPVASHAICQAAWHSGLRPWRKGDPRR